jgi:hypothetical protein
VGAVAEEHYDVDGTVWIVIFESIADGGFVVAICHCCESFRSRQ